MHAINRVTLEKSRQTIIEKQGFLLKNDVAWHSALRRFRMGMDDDLEQGELQWDAFQSESGDHCGAQQSRIPGKGFQEVSSPELPPKCNLFVSDS
jgi:hypothetical protein